MTLNLEHKQNLDELVEGCRAGNRKAQELVYRMLSSKMLGVCMRYAKDRFEAEDILQVAFIKIFEKVKEFKGEGSFEGWVRRIMVNTSIEFYRKNARMYPMVDLEHVPEKAVDENQMSRMNMNDLMKAIQSLSPGYRMIFNMYAIEGYSHKEIAAELNISEGTSKSQLARARGILQDYIINMEGSKHEAYGRK